MSPERWRLGQERREVLADQTRELAERLELIGIGAMKQTDHVAISAVTGAVDDVESYRAVKFLPLIASRDRRPILNALRYFQKNTEDGKWLRLAVVTAGVVIPAGGPLKIIARALKKNISRWASEADSTYGVHVVFRGVEFTRKRGDERLKGKHGEGLPSLHERDPTRFDAETLYYHVHANVLYRPRAGIDKAMWRHFLKWSRMRLGNVMWKDCGKLQNPEEACKYAFKPVELEGLPDTELRWLYHSTFRQNDMQPMGRLKEFRSRLENNVQRDAQGEPVIGADGEQIAERLKVTTVRTKNGAQLKIVRKRQPDPRPDPERNPVIDDMRPKPHRENLILTVTSPQARSTPWAEPVIMVAGYTENPTCLAGGEGLAVIKRIRDEATAAWRANGAPDPEIARSTARAWREAPTPEAASKIVALATQNRKRSRAEGAGSFKVHTCRLSAQATEGRVGAVTTVGLVPPPPRPRAVVFTETGEAYDPSTGELVAPREAEPGVPGVPVWKADLLPSVVHSHEERNALRLATYRDWQRSQWREKATRKRNLISEMEDS